jgi:hypothetical protein
VLQAFYTDDYGKIVIQQSGNTWLWRNSRELGKFEKSNLRKSSRYGEMGKLKIPLILGTSQELGKFWLPK